MRILHNLRYFQFLLFEFKTVSLPLLLAHQKWLLFYQTVFLYIYPSSFQNKIAALYITDHRVEILSKSCFYFPRQTWRLRCIDGALKFLNKDNIEELLLLMAEHEFRKVKVLLQAVNFTNCRPEM